MSGLFLCIDTVTANQDNEAADAATAARDGAASLPRPNGTMPNVTDRGRIKFGAGFRNASK